MRTKNRTAHQFSPAIVLLGMFCITLLAGSLAAQTPLPPDIENTRRPKAETSRLTPEQRDLARDYVDLLESLHLTVNDFTRYLSELQLNDLNSLTDQLRMVEELLIARRSTNDPNALSDKLKALRDKALAIETKLGHSAQERKAHKLTRQLAQELELISDQLTDDLAVRLNRTAQSRYRIVEVAQDSLRIRLEEHHHGMAALDEDLAHLEEARSAYEHARDEYEGAVAGVPVPPVMPVPPIPPVAAMPAPPDVVVLQNLGSLSTTNKQVIAFSKEGIGSVTKEFYDSTKVTSTKLPIIISNPIGDLIVTGWSRNVVQVQSTMRFSVPTKKQAEEITNETNLTIDQSSEAVRITVAVPRFTDSRVNLSQNRMVIYVPATNPVQLTAQFGSIQVSGINGGLKVNASNSRIDASGINGGVAIQNTFGAVNLVNVSGMLDVINSQAPVSIMNGNGPMHIATTFANIDLSKSKGKVTVEAAGHLMITDHIGDISAVNQNGSIAMDNIQGNVRSQNSFGSTSLKMISGSATVENTNTSLFLEGIRGLVDVENRFGSVSGQTLQGPIAIQNESGSVILVLNRDFNGNSTISSNFGSVQVIMPQESNGNLFVHSVGGQIQTTIPADVTTHGDAKQAVIAVGTGNKKLTVDGNGSTIIVSSKR